MEVLALKYRPRSFADLVGQQAVQVILATMVARDRVPAAVLLDGPRGTGKTTSARILAAALNCTLEPQPDSEPATARPCGTCPSCKSVFDGTSVDVVEIDAASNGLVDDIRALRTHMMYRAAGSYRVVILDEAHSMSGAAFNALLKTLEEPPPYTVFALLTTEPHRIPDTVLSRLMPFTFKRIGTADITARLAHICTAESLDVEDDLLHLIAERADGGMRDAIMTLDQITRAGVRTAAVYAELTGAADIAPQLYAALWSGDLAAAYTLLDQAMTRTGDPQAIVRALVTCGKHLLVLQAGGDIAVLGAARARRVELAAAVPAAGVVAAMRVLWELTGRTRALDPRAGLELVLALLADTFARFRPQPPAAAARRLSLAEMTDRR